MQTNIHTKNFPARLLIAFTALAAFAFAQEPFAADDTIAAFLKKQTGKQAELRLRSGEKISGTVTLVGEKAARITSLTGMEFFEAVVSIEEIAAIVVRTARQ